MNSVPLKFGRAKGIAIGWFSKHGYIVSTPLVRHMDYDLLVDNGKIQRVRVVSTSCKNKSGHWEATLATSADGVSNRKFSKRSCDLVFIACDYSEFYVIPTRQIKNTYKVVPTKNPTWRVNW